MLGAHKDPLVPPTLCLCCWKLPKCLLRTRLHTRSEAFLTVVLMDNTSSHTNN